MRRLDTRDPGFEPAFRALLEQARETTARVDEAVAAIIADVRARGDAALLEFTARFDRWTPGDAAGLLKIPGRRCSVTPEERLRLTSSAGRRRANAWQRRPAE